MNDQMTRWTVVVNKSLDRDVRRLLAERGGKKGDLSAFIRQAVETALFHQDLEEIRQRNKDLTDVELQELVDTELAEVRKDFWKDRIWWSETSDQAKP